MLIFGRKLPEYKVLHITWPEVLRKGLVLGWM
jgi:hypothetical protein